MTTVPPRTAAESHAPSPPGLDLAVLRDTVASGVTHDLAWRRRQLDALRRLIREHEPAITEAITEDVGKPAMEVRVTETSATVQEIDVLLANLERWTRPRRVPVPVVMLPATARVQLQPKGVVLVIAPWNYPLQLLLTPVAGALAAGNTVVLKPSEQVPRFSALVEQLVPRYFPRDVAQVVTGGVPQTAALLRERFDHIVFTGSTRVGRIVMRAAAEHLTPVTLELGGKSPAFVDDTMDLVVVARRLAWGKFTNAGQTCVAPDYVLVTPQAREPLLAALAQAVEGFFGADARSSPDLGRIIDGTQHERLVGLLHGHGGDVVLGGQHDAGDRFYLAPTVVADPDPGSALMTEEIFGPILPVLTVADAQEATEFVRSREHPLALYVFSTDEEVRAEFDRRTLSGGMSVGAPLLHLAAPGLPFGGVGSSGMGSYHGRASIEELSHHRSVLVKPASPDTLAAVYPPHPGWKRAAISTLMTPLGRPRVLASVLRAVRRRRG